MSIFVNFPSKKTEQVIRFWFCLPGPEWYFTKKGKWLITLKNIDMDACHMSFCQDTKLNFWEFVCFTVDLKEDRKNDRWIKSHLFYGQRINLKDRIEFYCSINYWITWIYSLITQQVTKIKVHLDVHYLWVYEEE